MNVELLAPGILDGARPPTARDEFIGTLVYEMEEMANERPVSFHDHVQEVNPGLLRYEHIPRLIDVGERVISGELENVLIMAPPRYFKTEVFGRLLSSGYLRRHPRRMVGLASYGADLAWSISEEARGYYREAVGGLDPFTGAKKRWRTALGGVMWASGVGGPILGFGYHLGIVDDPTDPEKAASYKYIRRFTKWWPEKWISRGEPNAQKVMVMQRLGTTDPIDFLLRREVGDDEELAPEHWHIVVCDEIKSNEKLSDYDGPMGLPNTCTLEPDHRKVGMVLAPSRMSEEEVKHRHRSSGPVTASTQRQQRPCDPEGDFWNRQWFITTYDELPDFVYNLGWDWDLAYTKEEANSASAGLRSGRGPGSVDEFIIYVDDVDWDWLEFPELIALMKEKDGPHYIEDKASGKSAKQSLSREGVMALTVPVKGDKLARASNVQPVVANGRIAVRKSILHQLLSGSRQGLLNVRTDDLVAGSGDLDLNDTFVQMITRHVGLRSGRRRFAFTPGGNGKEKAGNGSRHVNGNGASR